MAACCGQGCCCRRPNDARTFSWIRAVTAVTNFALLRQPVRITPLRGARGLEVESAPIAARSRLQRSSCGLSGAARTRSQFSREHRVHRVPAPRPTCVPPIRQHGSHAEADPVADIDINPADIRIDTFRASGGRQHITRPIRGADHHLATGPSSNERTTGAASQSRPPCRARVRLLVGICAAQQKEAGCQFG